MQRNSTPHLEVAEGLLSKYTFLFIHAAHFFITNRKVNVNGLGKTLFCCAAVKIIIVRFKSFFDLAVKGTLI